MRQRVKISVLMVGLIVAVAGQAAGQVALADQLKAQYTMVKMGADSHGTAVVEAGTILNIQKGGILGVPYSDTSVTPTHYQDGQVHTPNALVQKGIGAFMKKVGKEQNTHLFQIGEKVYPSHIDVNAQKDSVTIGIVACDSCNNTNPTTFYKADVIFQFAKGTLAAKSPPEVEDVIAQLFQIDNGDQGGNGNDQQQGNDQGNGQGGGGGQGGGQGGGGRGQAQQQAPPPEPQQIEKGQTPDQVKASLGPPDKIVNLGAKQIYVYKDLKVTFMNGKVSDVQ